MHSDISGLDDRLHRLERPPVITLTTDFGTHDGYVGTMKGVIHTLLPDAVVVDISHEVAPQQIQEGAFTLYRAYRYFPASAVHVAVVDPGVGGRRRAIVLRTGHGTFVGPDNGIFTYILRAEFEAVRDPSPASRHAWAGGMWGVAPNWASEEGRSPTSGEDSDYGEVTAFHLVNPDYWLPSVSSTFHGRDIFAPVAAHLASGAQPERMGERLPLEGLVKIPFPAPRVHSARGGTVVLGQIIYIDRFGNIITNLPDRLLAPLLDGAEITPLIEIGDHRIKGLLSSYSDVAEGESLALIGSERLLEVAVRNASAAQRMKVRVGDPVRITVGIRDQERKPPPS